MQHGYRKSNDCKRIIRRFVVKCGQIKKPPCESKWKIPVKLRDTPCTARERIPSLPGCRPIKQQKWTPLQVNLQGVYFHHFAWLVAFTKSSQRISTHLLARLGWFCPVVSEPVKPYFTRLLRVLTFCLGASKIVIFCENGVVKLLWKLKSRRQRKLAKRAFV